MKSARAIVVCISLVLCCTAATAKIEEETLCFQAAGNEKVHLAFKYYLDSVTCPHSPYQ